MMYSQKIMLKSSIMALVSISISLATSNELQAAPTQERLLEKQVEAAADDLEPDYGCLFDSRHPKCAAPPEGCHEGFGDNIYGDCLPNIPGRCPEGYHSTEDDETGQCYSNEGGCEYDDLVLNEDETICISKDLCDKFPNGRECLSKESHCNIYPDADYCKSDENKCQNQLRGNRCM